MGFIYENPKEYAKTCKCSIETATERCQYYLHLHGLMEKVTCPSCRAEYHNLVFDDDGSDFPTKTFISCTECWVAFDPSDERLKNFVRYYEEFDEILAISLDDEHHYGIENWEEYVKNATKEQLTNSNQ